VWWGENLGAPGIGFSSRFCRAGFEARRGQPTSPRFEASKSDDTLAMQRARMAQIRRDYDMGGSDRNPRRDLRPTARCVQEHAPA
jgi:hypothetical protein